MKALRTTIVSFLLSVAAASAWAHASLQSSVPAKGAEVPAPKEITLQFNEKLEAAFSTAKLIDAKGKDVVTGKAELDKNNPAVMKFAVPALAPGRYAVRFTAVSDDGHRRKGEFSFKVK